MFHTCHERAGDVEPVGIQVALQVVYRHEGHRTRGRYSLGEVHTHDERPGRARLGEQAARHRQRAVGDVEFDRLRFGPRIGCRFTGDLDRFAFVEAPTLGDDTTVDSDLFDTIVDTPTLRYASITMNSEGKLTRGADKKGSKRNKGQVGHACCGQSEGGGGCQLF